MEHLEHDIYYILYFINLKKKTYPNVIHFIFRGIQYRDVLDVLDVPYRVSNCDRYYIYQVINKKKNLIVSGGHRMAAIWDIVLVKLLFFFNQSRSLNNHRHPTYIA